MKITKTQQEFIKESTTSPGVCAAWRQDIKQTFPKLFKETELVVGKWVKTDHGSIFRIEKVKKDMLYGYGIGFYSKKWDKDYYATKDCCVLSTDKEVEEALIKEAKKRGFKEGVIVISPYNIDHKRTISSLFRFENTGLVFDSDEGARTHVLYRGKWATIIETITKEEAEKELGKTII